MAASRRCSRCVWRDFNARKNRLILFFDRRQSRPAGLDHRHRHACRRCRKPGEDEISQSAVRRSSCAGGRRNDRTSKPKIVVDVIGRSCLIPLSHLTGLTTSLKPNLAGPFASPTGRGIPGRQAKTSRVQDAGGRSNGSRRTTGLTISLSASLKAYPS